MIPTPVHWFTEVVLETTLSFVIETVFELITEEGCFMHMFNLSTLSIIVGRR